MNKLIHSPCKDCEDRQVGCHGKCKAYIEFANNRQRVLEEIRKLDGREFMETAMQKRDKKLKKRC